MQSDLGMKKLKVGAPTPDFQAGLPFTTPLKESGLIVVGLTCSSSEPDQTLSRQLHETATTFFLLMFFSRQLDQRADLLMWCISPILDFCFLLLCAASQLG